MPGNLVRALRLQSSNPGLNLAVELALVEVPGFGWVNLAITSRRDPAAR
jgi:hypothetical protein